MKFTIFVLCVTGVVSRNLPVPPPLEDNSYKEDYSTNYIDPVIFEPLPNITLSRSTYKIVGQIAFAPYFGLFSRYEDYFTKLKRDMFGRNPFQNGSRDCGSTQAKMFPSMSLHHEKFRPCKGEENQRKLEAEVNFLQKLFVEVKTKFYLAIDHVQTIDPERVDKSNKPTISPISDTRPYSRVKRDRDRVNRTKIPTEHSKRKIDVGINFTLPNITEGPLPPESRVETEPTQASWYMDLSDEEYDTIKELVQVYLARNPKLRSHLKRRFKRFGIMSWVLGWGIFKNFRQSAQTRRNIQILQQQNEHQDGQIQELAKFVKWSLVTLRTHHGLLHDINVKLDIIKIQLDALARELQNLEWYLNYHLHVQAALQRLTTGILIINEQVNKLYEYMRVMATHKLNPLIVNPTQLKIVLKGIQQKLKSHPRLSLPQDPETNIWDYYSISRITPVVENGYMIVILTIPLSDASLDMRLYKIHNLPSLHPELKVEVNYVLEGNYLAIHKDGEYAAIPTDREIQVCQVTRGFLCTLNSALYPIKKIEWCIYALFIKDADKITEYCMVDTKTRNSPRAINLGGFIWAVSALATETIFLRCVNDNKLIEIKSPLTIIKIPSGCEGWSNSINIPAKTELTSSSQVFQDPEWFTYFNMDYQNFTNYGIWKIFNIQQINKLESELYGTVLGEFPQFKIKYLKKQFDEMVDLSKVGLHPKFFIAIAITVTIAIAVVVVLVLYKYGRLHNVLRAVKTNVKSLSVGPLPVPMTNRKFPIIHIRSDTPPPTTPIPPPRKFHWKPKNKETENKTQRNSSFLRRKTNKNPPKQKRAAPLPPQPTTSTISDRETDEYLNSSDQYDVPETQQPKADPNPLEFTEKQLRRLAAIAEKELEMDGLPLKSAKLYLAKKHLSHQAEDQSPVHHQ